MKKFNTGDTVKRIRGEHQNSYKGRISIITKIENYGSIHLDCDTTPNTAHDSDNFELVKDLIYEIF